MSRDEIINGYFQWLCDRVDENRMFTKLLTYLHTKKFRWIYDMDSNRADDGESFRERYAGEGPHFYYILDCLDGPCTMLEMLVALAVRIEENIMDNAEYGDRTSQWFWCMVVNLGLGHMDNARFDKKKADDIVERFLDRKYAPDGKGGLFKIKGATTDLRDVGIWTQMLWYMNDRN